jgi:acetolactate synthase-1/2/3 large subunit
VCRAIGAVLPEGAIISDEAQTSGLTLAAETAGAPPHDVLALTGGSIGQGLPVAVGAAIACPDRPVIALEADGSAMYTIQSLWTQARERLDVTTVIMANRKYAILLHELANVGANPGRTALDMLDLGNPDLDFVRIAQGMGVEAARAETMERFNDLFAQANTRRGPFVIELVI